MTTLTALILVVMVGHVDGKPQYRVLPMLFNVPANDCLLHVGVAAMRWQTPNILMTCEPMERWG